MYRREYLTPPLPAKVRHLIDTIAFRGRSARKIRGKGFWAHSEGADSRTVVNVIIERKTFFFMAELL
jgi:hypothetical protein